MKLRFASLVAAAVMATAAPALADLVVPNLSYRTGPYAANGTQYADGFNDYFTLLNERDGGIGGQKIQVPECETAYNTEKGVECYESTKGQGALVYNPFSTGITYQLIPKASTDKIPLYTPGYGRTSSKNGKVFEWVFNAPANYWDGASVIVKHLLDVNGGKLDGKKIALVYHNSAYGKEPIRTLQELGKKHGFTLTELPVEPPGQEQKSQWLQIRREKPDHVILYGWGVMNQAATIRAATPQRTSAPFLPMPGTLTRVGTSPQAIAAPISTPNRRPMPAIVVRPSGTTTWPLPVMKSRPRPPPTSTFIRRPDRNDPNRCGASRKSSALRDGGVSTTTKSHLSSARSCPSFSMAMYSCVPAREVATVW